MSGPRQQLFRGALASVFFLYAADGLFTFPSAGDELLSALLLTQAHSVVSCTLSASVLHAEIAALLLWASPTRKGLTSCSYEDSGSPFDSTECGVNAPCCSAVVLAS